MSRILIVDDDLALLKSLSLALTSDGHEVGVATDGLGAIFEFYRKGADLVVLDIIMPKANGFEAMEAIRRKAPDVPIFFLSSHGADEDRIKGLSLGADDYLGKPINITEFRVRVKGLLRRAGKAAPATKPVAEGQKVTSGPYTFDFQRFRLYKGLEAVPLSPREMRLLEALLGNTGTIHSRQDLLAMAWPADAQPSLRSVDVHMARLRGKIDPDGAIQPILTLPGEGYRWALGVGVEG